MKYFFFDLDGTLEDSRQDMVAAACSVRAALNLAARSFEQLVPHVNRGMRELYLNCFDEYCVSPTLGVDEEKLQRVEHLYTQQYGEHIADQTRLYDGVRDVLSMAKQQGRVAVITNKPEALSTRLLTQLDVIDCVDLVVGGDTCAEAKPSALPLRYALTQLGGELSRDVIFMVGDSQGDALAGHRLGVWTVWCQWGYLSQPPTQPPAQLTAATPYDLKEIFTSTSRPFST